MTTANLFDFLKASRPCFNQTLNNLIDSKGPQVSFRLLGQKFIVVSDSQMIKDLIAKNPQRLIKGRTLKEVTAITKGVRTITESDGEEWAALRAAFTPHFAKALMKEQNDVVAEIANKAAKAIRGRTFDLQDVTTRMAFDSVCRILFSYEPEGLWDLQSPFSYLENQKFLVEQLGVRLKRGPLWKYLPIPSNFEVKKCSNQNAEFLDRILQKRRQSDLGDKIDFLDVLMLLKDKNDQPISDTQIHVHMYGVMGAAFESTGAVLHWALAHLALDSELQARVREDQSMELAKKVINEVMRLYPPFPMLIRECIEDIAEPVSVRRGTFVINLVGRSHRDPKLWGADADQFRPSRFDNLTLEQKTSFAPFGIGRRMCPGEPMARMEMPILLMGLLRDAEYSIPSAKLSTPLLRFALGPSQPTMAHARQR